MTDPNWLLATMAQSAAALVAIAGGFLVSRVVTLASERQGLERRARELEQQTQEQAERLRGAHRRRQAVSWEFFVNLAADKCARRYEQQGSVSPEWLADEHWVRGVPTRNEMLDLANRLIRTTQQASEHFESGGDIPGSLVDDWEVYRAVYNAQPSSSGWTGPFDSDIERVWKQERYDKLIESERDLQAGLSALEREGDLVRTETARVTKPHGLGRAAAAFGYLTVAGVVVPLAGLAWRPVPSDLLSRRVLVFLFVSGLAGLGWYLIWAIRQLAEPSNPQVRNEQTTR